MGVAVPHQLVRQEPRKTASLSPCLMKKTAPAEQALFGDSLPALLEALWCGMELDLDDLLREATAVVLKGNSHGLPAVDPAVRDQRIKMLALVADVFEAVSTNYLATHPEPPASESLERAAMAAAVFRQHGADADVDIDAVYREWQAAGSASAYLSEE